MPYDRAALAALIREKAIKFGEFTLASGQKSTYYLDGKQVTLDAAGAKLVAEGMLELLNDDDSENGWPDAVGGMSIGADPIVGALVAVAGMRRRPLKGFMVRKDAKGHGTQNYIEGPVRSGDSAVIVEDVVTTGGSSHLAIERAEEFGLKITRVLAIVDRRQGGADAFRGRGYAFDALFTVEDFGIAPK